MDRQEIMNKLTSLTGNIDMVAIQVTNSLNEMDKLEQLKTLCEIVDNPYVNLDYSYAVLKHFMTEFKALRTVNKSFRHNNEDSSIDNTARLALELLESK